MPPTRRSGTGVSSGFLTGPVRSVANGTTTLSLSDLNIIVSAALGNASLVLPTAIGNSGLQFYVIRTDATANTVTLSTTGGQTINGVSSVGITSQYQVVSVVSDGANWLIMASPGTFASPANVLWTFPGTLSTDQNANLYTLVATSALTFVGVDAEVNVAPAGADIIVNWEINGATNVNLQTTITAGTRYAQALFVFSLAVNDTLHPIISQVGAQTPGLTLVMRARGQ